METFAARLASFDVSNSGSKGRRASSNKSSKALTWPHQSPSPSELAFAGFYYKPSATGPDNTCCFLCERTLDGWEEDDDPAIEHLRHSSECGWAITINAGQNSLDPAELEDPTGERMSQARKATFSIGWPHDGKRGWTCKTQKMVDAGWYYCPTPECEDFVTCTYCKLSLDGWEPKDNPYNEHYKRSPDCPFFAFKAPSQKVVKTKKGRQSKASRMSTQSSMIADTDTSNIPEFDDSIDISLISQDTVVSTASKMGTKGKKGGKGQAKNTRARKAEPVDVEDNEAPPPPPPAKSTRGRKRTSDEISQDEHERGARESTVKPEPPPKRRATRNRDSNSQQISYPAISESADSTVMEIDSVAITKPARGGRKRASSRTRKVSTASTASKASLRSKMPDVAEIDAALEADLDRPLSDEEDIKKGNETVKTDNQAPESQPKKGRGKTTTKKGTASTAPTRRTRKDEAKEELQEESKGQEASVVSESFEMMRGVETDTEPPKKSKATRTKKAAAASKKGTKSASQTTESKPIDSSMLMADTESSMLTAPTIEDDSGHETDASTASRSTRQKGGRKRAAKGKGKKGGVMSKNIEDIVQPSQPAVSDIEVEKDGQDDSRPAESATEETKAKQEVAVDEPPKKATRGKGTKAKGPKAKKQTKAPHLSMPGAFSPPPVEATPDPEQNDQTRDSVTDMLNSIQVPATLLGVGADQRMPLSLAQRLSMRSEISAESVPLPIEVTEDREDEANVDEDSHPAPTPKMPAPSPTATRATPQKLSTPLPSPQSSDAENQPPSARPEHKRPPILSPSGVHPSPAKPTTTKPAKKVALAPSTPNKTAPLSPSKQQNNNQISSLTTTYPWTSVDVELAFLNSATPGNENAPALSVFGTEAIGSLDEQQRKMSVEEWIRWLAATSEEELRREGERAVGVFEREGGRAMRVLEGVGCCD